MAKLRFRRLTDLFVVGQAVALPDDSGYLWVQALSPYQRDEAISDAQVGRARIVMAMREAGEEKLKIEARFYETGREKAIEDLATSRMQDKIGEFVEDLRADPEWRERLDILLRTDQDDTAEPITPEEVALLARLNTEVMDELKRREDDEAAYQRRHLDALNDEELVDEWNEAWLEQRGSALAAAEYRLTEIMHATRYCQAVAVTDGELDHSNCEGHSERVFETRTDVREAPQDLVSLIQAALVEINVEGRDPKDSGNPANSSASSPTPSEAEESTPSTSNETSTEPPGTSPSPSPTPSPSSAGSR
jgi:hypothetical protein